MEFSFDVSNVLPGRITILETGSNNESYIKIYDLNSNRGDGQDINKFWTYHLSANIPWDIKLKKKKEELVNIIDELGHASAQAQSLRRPITTLKKLLNSQQQKIFILRDSENTKGVIGFLKIGCKRLFLCDDAGAHHELDPLCVLDFYVHESKQRLGFGHELFNIMLLNERMTAEKLAIDRPSFKFLSFLQKHYNLTKPITQSNNFVIFTSFFLNREVKRPPIFLYCGKVIQPETSHSLKKSHSRPGSHSSDIEAFNSIKVSLRTDELKKNKTFYSSAANCLTWNDDGNVTTNYKKFCSPIASSYSKSDNTKNTGNFNHRSPVQSCSSAHNRVEGWNTSYSTPCSLTPVNTNSSYSQRNWDQMQSSWNILGVKPIDYTIYQKQS